MLETPETTLKLRPDTLDTQLYILLHQVRHRDRVSREVIIEERRYDKAGQEHTPSANVSTRGEPFDTTSLDSLDIVDEAPVPPSSLAASALASSFGSSYVDDEANSDNPYAWAQRLRDIPDKVIQQKQAPSHKPLQRQAEDITVVHLHVCSACCHAPLPAIILQPCMRSAYM